MLTRQVEGVEDKKDTNSMLEENDVSNRHTTRSAWWTCGQRTTLADGARPSKDVASSQKGSRTGSP